MCEEFDKICCFFVPSASFQFLCRGMPGATSRHRRLGMTSRDFFFGGGRGASGVKRPLSVRVVSVA